MDNNNTPLATEVIRTLKKIIYILIVLELLTIGGFMWYLSLPVDDTTTTQTIEDIDDGEITQVEGDYSGESNSNSTESEKNNKK